MKRLTQERLREVLDYDADLTGMFTRIESTCGHKAGDMAGCIGVHGYVQVVVDGKTYRAHRLAWLYVHGYMSENPIDHINRNRADNRIVNLREVSQQCNTRNRSLAKNNKSGIKGVNWNKNANKWHVKIMVDYNRIHLGYYKEFDNAVCARLAAEQCLGWAGCDSSSPAFLYVQKMLQRQPDDCRAGLMGL